MFKKLKARSIALNGTPVTELRDVTSSDIWDHSVLHATRHRWTRPALTQARRGVLDLPIPDGWKAEFTWLLVTYIMFSVETNKRYFNANASTVKQKPVWNYRSGRPN